MPSSPPEANLPRLKLVSGQQGYARLLGPCYEIALAQGMRRALLLDARHLNAEGVIDAGVIAGFGEFVLARGVRDEVGDEPRHATIELSCQYLAAAFANRWIYGEAHILRRTANLVFAAAEVFDAQRRIAFVSGIWKRLGEAGDP